MRKIDTNAAILLECFDIQNNQIAHCQRIMSIQVDVPKIMASLAKLMTVMLVWDKVKQNNLDPALTFVEMPVDLLKGSSEYYKFYQKNEKIPLSVLVQSALIASSNEAAFALACWHSGDEVSFITKMVRKSQVLGLSNSRWCSSSGLNKNAHTTAQDMSTLAKIFISQYPEVATYCALKSFTFNGKRVLNTNKLMHTHANILGIKTGNLVGIGSNLINHWTDDGLHYLSVVLGAESRKACYELSTKMMIQCRISK